VAQSDVDSVFKLSGVQADAAQLKAPKHSISALVSCANRALGYSLWKRTASNKPGSRTGTDLVAGLGIELTHELDVHEEERW